MLIASELLAEVEELRREKKNDPVSIERIIERVLDRHGVSDDAERIRLSAEIGLEHIKAVITRSRIARADKRHAGREAIERRMGLL